MKSVHMNVFFILSLLISRKFYFLINTFLKILLIKKYREISTQTLIKLHICTWIRLLGADDADWAARGLRDHADDDGLELGTGIGVARGETGWLPEPFVATANGLGEDFRSANSNWWWRYVVTGGGAPISPCSGLFRLLMVSLIWFSTEGNGRPSALLT